MSRGFKAEEFDRELDYGTKAHARNVHPGDELALSLEPDNIADDRAVALYHRGFHLGYVPARHRWVFRALTDDSEALVATVTRIEVAGIFFRRAKRIMIRIAIV